MPMTQIWHQEFDTKVQRSVDLEARSAMVTMLSRAARTPDTMYTSEPLPARPSAFYAGDRYYANEEDARRAQRDLDAEQLAPVQQLSRVVRGRSARRTV